jgi:hypothetical protein
LRQWRQDPGREARGTSAVDQAEEGVDVDTGLTGELFGEVAGETCLYETAQPPFGDIQGGPVTQTRADRGGSDGHALLASRAPRLLTGDR